MREDVRRKLIEVAKKGQTITYGDLMKEFRIPRGHKKPNIGIGGVVGKISEYEHSNNRPLLSVIVVRAGKSKDFPLGHPGGGILGLPGIPRHLVRKSVDHTNPKLNDEEVRFLQEEQDKVWKYWKSHD